MRGLKVCFLFGSSEWSQCLFYWINKKIVLEISNTILTLSAITCIGTFSGDATLSFSFFSSLLNEWLTLAPSGTNSLLQGYTPFWKGFILQRNKQDITTVISLRKNWVKHGYVPTCLKVYEYTEIFYHFYKGE